VTGICSTLNNNFATAAFMSFDRLQEMTQANANYMGATTQTKTAEEKTNGPTYDLVWVKVKNVNDVQRIVKLIRDTGLNTYSLNDMLETVRTQSRQIQGMLGALGGIAVLISAICVANTMMMSITERTREIGVLKVLGTIRGDIFKMFLTEALIVGVIGGPDIELYRQMADTGDLRVPGAAVRAAVVAGGLRRAVRRRGSHCRRVDARPQGNAHQPQRSHPL